MSLTNDKTGRPPLPEEERRKFTGFMLPPSVIEVIKAEAKAHGSQANVIVAALRAYRPQSLAPKPAVNPMLIETLPSWVKAAKGNKPPLQKQ